MMTFMHIFQAIILRSDNSLSLCFYFELFPKIEVVVQFM